MVEREQTSEEIVEGLRKYTSDGDAVHRYWMEPLDKWWDIGFYFHVFVLIGFWMLYNAVTTGYMTRVQFMLDHTITVFWVYCAGIYSFTVVVQDIIAAAKK